MRRQPPWRIRKSAAGAWLVLQRDPWSFRYVPRCSYPDWESAMWHVDNTVEGRR